MNQKDKDKLTEAKELSDKALSLIAAVVDGLSNDQYLPYELEWMPIGYEELGGFELSVANKKEVVGAINHIHLNRLADYINDGWTPDYSNANQYKYYLYFNHSEFEICVGNLLAVYSREDECRTFETKEKALLFCSEAKRLGLKYLGVEL